MKTIKTIKQKLNPIISVSNDNFLYTARAGGNISKSIISDNYNNKNWFSSFPSKMIYTIDHDEHIKEHFLQETIILSGHADSVTCLEISENYLYSGSYKIIKKWDITTNRQVAVLIGHQATVSCLIALDGYLYSGSCDKTIKKWDLSETLPLEVASFEGHQSIIFCMIISKPYLYSGSSDGTIKKWNLEFNHQVTTLSTRGNAIICLLIFDGYLYSGNRNGTIKKWDINNDQEVFTFTDNQYIFNNLAISSNRTSYLYSTGNDPKVWSTDEISLSFESDLIHGYLKCYTDGLINVCLRCFL